MARAGPGEVLLKAVIAGNAGLSQRLSRAKLRPMSRLVRNLRAFAPLAFVACAVIMTAAHTRPARGDVEFSGWLGLRAGLSTNDSFIVGEGNDSFTSDAPPSFSLGLSAWLQAGLIDIGVIFETASASGTPAVAFNERLYSQFRVLPTLRWRFIDDGWGGATMGLGFGASISRLSEFLRFEIARTRGLNLEQVEQTPVGFAVSFDFGIYVLLDDGVRLTTLLGIQNTTGDLAVGDITESFLTLQALFQIGLEWTL